MFLLTGQNLTHVQYALGTCMAGNMKTLLNLQLPVMLVNMEALVVLKAHLSRSSYHKISRTLEDVQMCLRLVVLSLFGVVSKLKDHDDQTWIVACCFRATIMRHTWS